MPLSIDWKVGVDGSQGISALTQLQAKMKDVGNTARSELSQKLKTVFEVAAIEEAVRRTAQWAQEIQQTSKQLGVSAEALQTLQTIANKTGLPQDAVTGMFENITRARDQALAGNTDLIISFQNLGVSIRDLQTLTKSELFGKFLKGLPAGNIQNAAMYLRQSVAQTTGNTPENYINEVTNQTKRDFVGYMKAQEESGAVLSEGTISQLSATWTDILQQFREMGNTLKPAAGFLLGIVDTFVTALSGIAQALKNGKDILVGILTGNIGKVKSGGMDLKGLGDNATYGVAKAFTSLTDMISRGAWGVISTGMGISGHLPGKTGKTFRDVHNYINDELLDPDKNKNNSITSYIQRAQDIDNKKFGYSANTIRRGEAMGVAASILGPGGITKILTGGKFAAGAIASPFKTFRQLRAGSAAAEESLGFAPVMDSLKPPVLSPEMLAKQKMAGDWMVKREAELRKVMGLDQPASSGDWIKIVAERTQADLARRGISMNKVTNASGVSSNVYTWTKTGKQLTDEEKSSAMNASIKFTHDERNRLATEALKRPYMELQLQNQLKSEYQKMNAGAPAATMSARVKENEQAFGKLFDKYFNPKTVGIASGAGIYSSMFLGAANGTNISGNNSNDIRPIVPNVGYFQGVGQGSGTAMLKFGGTFGSGFQSRLIQLNESMLAELSKISAYMSFVSQPANRDNPTTPPGLQ